VLNNRRKRWTGDTVNLSPNTKMAASAIFDFENGEIDGFGLKLGARLHNNNNNNINGI